MKVAARDRKETKVTTMTRGKGKRKFAIALAMTMILQGAAFTSAFAAEAPAIDEPEKPAVESYLDNDQI